MKVRKVMKVMSPPFEETSEEHRKSGAGQRKATHDERGNRGMDERTYTKQSSQDLTVAQRRAAQMLATGHTQADAARAIGRARQTVNAWVRRDPSFRAEINRLLEVPRQQVFDALPNLLHKAIVALDDALSMGYMSKSKLQAAEYLLDRVLSLLVSSSAMEVDAALKASSVSAITSQAEAFIDGVVNK